MPIPAINVATTQDDFIKLGYQDKYRDCFFEGDALPLGTHVHVHTDQAVVGDCRIYDLRTRTGIAFRRSWHHIRKDRTDLIMCVFPRVGHAMVSLTSGEYIVGPGECMLIRSAVPFLSQNIVGTAGNHESMHVHVPSCLFSPSLIAGLEFGKPITTQAGGLFVAERMMAMLFKESARVEAEMADSLLKALLHGVIRAVEKVSTKGAPRLSICERRLKDVLRYIDQRFANPDLDANTVAKDCGISVRYLCHVMKKHGKSFSSVLWEKRITTAFEWIRDPSMRHYQLREIAYLAGFKTTAHFSRVFKKRYGMTAMRLHSEGGPARA
jgi:AraC family transcriptional regulator, positive regulator of tynA and feaB